MEIKKGSVLNIVHSRKGTFQAIAIEDFDTEIDEWYPVAACEDVEGRIAEWTAGDEIPCRRGLSRVKVVKEPNP